MPRDPLNVLVSAYACGPGWGSEIGMGWNWILHLANHCQLDVITEGEFQADIEGALGTANVAHRPRFHYINVEPDVRRSCWNQGDWRFYRHYREWQERARVVAEDLVNSSNVDLCHHLNFTGYREPGFLWTLRRPFVWGPVGGHAQLPWRFIPKLGPKEAAYHCARNIVNGFQMRHSPSVSRAMKMASAVIASTSEDGAAIKKHHHRPVFVINETGASLPNTPPRVRSWQSPRTLQVLWCGRFVGRKALPLLLHALPKIVEILPVQVHIVGYGPEEQYWRQLAVRLRVNDHCVWHGKVPHGDVPGLMEAADCLAFTSLQEGTPHVVQEAIAAGLPVVCHDNCGQGDVITEACGIKIPVVSPSHSINAFANAILQLALTPLGLAELSRGAFARAQELSWQAKAARMVSIYDGVVRNSRWSSAGQLYREAVVTA